MPTGRSSVVSKLPELTFLFWVMKICATTLGETAGDLFSKTLHIGYAVSSLILFSIFVVVLGIQLISRRYVPFLYWGVILATSTAGTTMSDFMDRTLGLGYALGSAILIGLLACVLGAWRLSEGTLDVGSVRSRRAEAFYWIAILFSNTLGTALGDYLADDSGLGFMGGAALISGVLAVIAGLYFFTKLSRIALFWAAFVLTRPFGATMGDVLARDHDEGGLGFGTGWSSAVLLAVLVGVILYSMRGDAKRESVRE